MPRPQIIPDSDTLRQWHEDEGLSHAQIARRVYERTGYPVTRSAISVALHRAGLSKPSERYKEEIPWTLHGKDLRSYPARMLRLLARKRRGLDITTDESNRLQRWLDRCRDEDCVVAWDPDRNPSLFYVRRRPGDDEEIPIRRERVFTNPNNPHFTVTTSDPD